MAFLCIITPSRPSGEMVDTEDLKSSDENRAGSSPASGTKSITDYLKQENHYATRY